MQAAQQSIIDDKILESLSGEMRLIAEKMHYYLATKGWREYTNHKDGIKFNLVENELKINLI